jgi:hypothetical protein
MNHIISFLRKLNFSGTEIGIYTTLLQDGPLSISELAEKISYYSKLISKKNYFFNSNIAAYFMYDNTVALLKLGLD